MFIYLFLLAAAAASSELPTTDLTPDQVQVIQELTAMIVQEETQTESLVQPQITTIPDAQTAPITITNAIEPSMLEYKHWTGKYSPEQFAITINGTEIESGKTCEISAKATTVEIGYTYSFMNGMRTGGKKISYQLNENVTQAHITFNWKDDWRIIVDHGKALKEVTT